MKMQKKQVEDSAPRNLQFPKRSQDIVNNLRNLELFQSSPTTLASIWAWALVLGYLEEKNQVEDLGKSPAPLAVRDSFERYYGDLAFYVAAVHKMNLSYLDRQKEGEVYEIAQSYVNAGIFLLDKLLLDVKKTETREDILLEKILSSADRKANGSPIKAKLPLD